MLGVGRDRTMPRLLRGCLAGPPAFGASRNGLASVDRVKASAAHRCIVRTMPENEPMQTTIAEIAGRVDQLVELCRRLSEENRSLRHSQEQLASERAGLLARNEQARARVEAMIGRLKSLEQNQA